MKKKILKPIIKNVEDSSLIDDVLSDSIANKRYNYLEKNVSIKDTFIDSCVFENIDFSLIIIKTILQMEYLYRKNSKK